MQTTYYRQNRGLSILYHWFITWPADMLSWCEWKIRLSGLIPFVNLSKYVFVVALSWGVATSFFMMSEPLTLTKIIILITLCVIIIGFDCLVIYTGWYKWRGRSRDIDEIWKETGEALGLTLTLTPSKRKLSGPYQDVFVEVADQYTILSSLPGRTLGIAGRMAGVTIKIKGSSQQESACLNHHAASFTASVVKKANVSEQIASLSMPLQQKLREIFHQTGKIFSLSISNSTLRFVHEAFTSDADAQESHDIPYLPLRQLIEAHVLFCKAEDAG